MPLNIVYNHKDLLRESASTSILIDLPANGAIEALPRAYKELPKEIVVAYKKACIAGDFTPGKILPFRKGNTTYHLLCNRWADFGESLNPAERVLFYTEQALKKLEGHYATIVLGSKYKIWQAISQIKVDNKLVLNVYVRRAYD